MRVAYTVEQCWHRVPGGTAVAAIETARALVETGVDVVGVAGWHRHAPLPQWRPPVEVRHVPLPRRVLYEAWLRLRWPPVERTVGRVDVVHATTLIVPPCRAPLVVTVHDLAFVHEPRHFTAHGVAAFQRGVAVVRDRAAAVLCSSLATLADCLSLGLEAERLRHVPLGVRAAPVEPAEAAAARARYRLPERFLLFTGTIEPRKNLPSLLAAVADLDEPIVLAVVGPSGWGDEIGSRAERLGERVRLLGFVPEHDLRALYAACTVFCYPSRREGFGLPVLEAMAQGAAVVTSRGTSTEEVAGESAVLVDPLDIADITRGIEAALARRAELSSLARRRAAQFSWRATAERTAAVYREVVDR